MLLFFFFNLDATCVETGLGFAWSQADGGQTTNKGSVGTACGETIHTRQCILMVTLYFVPHPCFTGLDRFSQGLPLRCLFLFLSRCF